MDRHSNTLSIFDVIEKIRFADGELTGEQIKTLGAIPYTELRIRVTAVWRRGPDEVGEYEFRTIVFEPGVDEPIVLGEGMFAFKTELHRFVSTLTQRSITTEGTLRIRNEIRRVGDVGWTGQEYAMPVVKISSPAPNSSGEL